MVRNILQRITVPIILLLIPLTISACAHPALTLEPDHLDMLVSLDGEEDDYYEELILRCNGQRVNGRKVNWHSDNTDVAVVDKTGWITSKGAGTAVISAGFRGGTVSCTVEVKRKITSDSFDE